MPRQHIDIQIGRESPIRIITSPDDERAKIFNVLVPKNESIREGFEWGPDEIDEFAGVTEAELLEMFTIALRDLPFYPPDGRGGRRMTAE